MIFLDMQCFYSDGELVPKELAVYDGEQLSHYIFKPPCAFRDLSDSCKKQIVWLENNYHGLKWSRGFTPLSEISRILRDKCFGRTVLVKGLEKTNFIHKFRCGALSICECPFTYPALHTLYLSPACQFHTVPYDHCAITNVLILYHHYHGTSCKGDSSPRT